MSAYTWAALIAGAIAVDAAAAAFFIGRGKLINEWRDSCAEHARRQQFQQFDVEPRYVDAEFARIASELDDVPFDQERS